MISTRNAVLTGVWLFQYPKKLCIWSGCWTLVFYILGSFILGPLSTWKTEWLTIGGQSVGTFLQKIHVYDIIGFISYPLFNYIFIPSIIITPLLYLLLYKKWKKWALMNVGNKDEFLREALRNNFSLSNEELTMMDNPLRVNFYQ